MSLDLPPELRELAVEMICVHPKHPMTCGSCGEPLQHLKVLMMLGADFDDGDVAIHDRCGTVLRMDHDQTKLRRMTVDEFLAMPAPIQACAKEIAQTIKGAGASAAAKELLDRAFRRT